MLISGEDKNNKAEQSCNDKITISEKKVWLNVYEIKIKSTLLSHFQILDSHQLGRWWSDKAFVSDAGGPRFKPQAS